jgi:glycoprotein endo-alpha-1,2-mannosidase
VGNSEEIQQWYIHQSSTGGITIGSAFPRFKDYYDIAQTGEYYPDFPAEGGQRFKDLLNLAYLHNLDYLQLVTWNDFGEGTQLEPTAEEGFFYLDLIQQYTEINRDVLDL